MVEPARSKVDAVTTNSPTATNSTHLSDSLTSKLPALRPFQHPKYVSLFRSFLIGVIGAGTMSLLVATTTSPEMSLNSEAKMNIGLLA